MQVNKGYRKQSTSHHMLLRLLGNGAGCSETERAQTSVNFQLTFQVFFSELTRKPIIEVFNFTKFGKRLIALSCLIQFGMEGSTSVRSFLFLRTGAVCKGVNYSDSYLRTACYFTMQSPNSLFIFPSVSLIFFVVRFQFKKEKHPYAAYVHVESIKEHYELAL